MKNKICLIFLATIALVFFLTGAQERGMAMAKETERNNKAGLQCILPLNEEELKKVLTSEQYRVMRQNGTELPFANAYWDNKRSGIYVDAISGEPLFSSTDKFDSGTGWPSFTKPLDRQSIDQKNDSSTGLSRTEVRASKSNSHLGHVFADGPKPTGQRYCINSAALRFIPAEDLEKEGYSEYLSLFQNKTKPKTIATAAFGGGCFWGVEAAFRELDGVINTSAGYMGGETKDPTYEEVCTDKTGHAETVLVEYDPAKLSYQQLLEFFWRIHDPTTLNRQGPDAGTQYRSVIFFYTPEQKSLAEQTKRQLSLSGKFKKPVVTQIVPASEFYKAEEYHQRYFEKSGIKPTCHIPQK